MTHFSGGQYNSDSWKQAYNTFCQFNWPAPAAKGKALPKSHEPQEHAKTSGSQPI